MGDLLAFDGYVNASTPFAWQEHDYVWKTDRRYLDFQPGNDHNASCEYPRMWGEDGYRLPSNITDLMQGCKSSEYDQVLHTPYMPTETIDLHHLVRRHQRYRSLPKLPKSAVKVRLGAGSITRVEQ